MFCGNKGNCCCFSGTDKEGFYDNSAYFSIKTYVVGTH